ncbi:hypothetical protein AUK04_00415 [Candidatus Roizmanbacteria bacterium CG2_30_33_16]|uniref:Acyltransferase 3 domain-containing protein n=3 Tax=Candidatus Roizmaniibacteriota TaxID=1752723 RepID=A0A2M7E3X8_9BACT|nr:acyltransferase [Candidatus Roizmanbacteria bacterium]OIP86554.1 MAG: hypothetical protein AUK04_00415 [Candidatus Roizmanbacteria bacterium CG2_30_33_16]PIV62419.1 MAG: hypothetical protein COS12_02500 [Candidatus Roizmanbacteria bacterium CG01_land_8_20_14_3_00_33_9]PIX73773.1 MAG: hypothetical protein COZ39_01890 [Candidatus Roizmanbacteria bacterium CG_4_10_14_3_um_filter_33_21]
MQQRNQTIDSLRGLSIIAMIAIHTFVFYLSQKGWVEFSWNWLQFAVPIFVFCSAYIFWQKPLSFERSAILSHIKKRVIRLLIPYYLFLLVFLPINFIKTSKNFSFTYIFKSLTLTGGIDINWLVLLFFMFIFLQIIIAYLLNNHRNFFYLYMIIVFISTIILLFIRPKFDYKLIMWLPWSLITIFAYYFVRFEKSKKWLVGSVIFTAALFVISYQILVIGNYSLRFFSNKYPPNLYILSYGLLSIALLFVIFKFINTRFKTITNILSFYSLYSYEIFFIQYVVIYLLNTHLKTVKYSPFGFFVVVLLITTLLQLGLNKARFHILRF